MCDVGVDHAESVFYRHLIGPQPQNMTLELLETLLEQAKSFAERPRFGLAYTEPLIHPQIRALCAAVVRHGYFCSITTNGYLLPSLAADLVEIGVDEITVSVDGPPEVHDRIRGKAGSFARIEEGVARVRRARQLSGRRRPSVGVSCTITDANHALLPELLRAVEPLQPAYVSLSHPNFISAEMAAAHNGGAGSRYPVTASNLGPMDLQSFDLDALWAGLRAVKSYVAARPGFPRFTVVPDFEAPDRLHAFYREPSRFVGGRTCTDPWRMLLVRTDGTVVPAHGRCYDVPLGNVSQAPLAALWNGDAARGFRRDLLSAGGTLPACARCCGVIGKPTASAI
jgi:MoaA/NifB/PqqE/SkfB family radical SAM enzyme